MSDPTRMHHASVRLEYFVECVGVQLVAGEEADDLFEVVERRDLIAVDIVRDAVDFLCKPIVDAHGGDRNASAWTLDNLQQRYRSVEAPARRFYENHNAIGVHVEEISFLAHCRTHSSPARSQPLHAELQPHCADVDVVCRDPPQRAFLHNFQFTTSKVFHTLHDVLGSLRVVRFRSFTKHNARLRCDAVCARPMLDVLWSGNDTKRFYFRGFVLFGEAERETPTRRKH